MLNSKEKIWKKALRDNQNFDLTQDLKDLQEIVEMTIKPIEV